MSSGSAASGDNIGLRDPSFPGAPQLAGEMGGGFLSLGDRVLGPDATVYSGSTADRISLRGCRLRSLGNPQLFEVCWSVSFRRISANFSAVCRINKCPSIYGPAFLLSTAGSDLKGFEGRKSWSRPLCQRAWLALAFGPIRVNFCASPNLRLLL
jgi:hypothetical protein